MSYIFKNIVFMNFPFYLAGKFQTSETPLFIKSPYNNEIVGQTWLATNDDFNYAITQAEKAFLETRNMPTHQRAAILNQIANKLEENSEYFAKLITLESAKPLKYSLAEVDRTIQTYRIAAEETKRIDNEYFSIDWTEAGTNKEGFIKHFPLGVIAGISPFNFPLNLTAHKIAPAIATGNTIILKPSSSTPLSILALAKIIDETSLPKGAISILPTDRKTGNILTNDKRIKKITFTGSPSVGWNIKNSAYKKRITLELGGNAAAIITPSGFSQETVNKCVSGAFSFSGQVCIHLQRIYVEKSNYKEFLSLFLKETEKIKIGDPLDKTTDLSAVINYSNKERIENWISEAEKQGAKKIYYKKQPGNIVNPTILTNTNKNMRVNYEEIFGPVVCIEQYTEFQDVINKVNESPFGLQAGIFSDSLSQINKAFNEIEVGGLIVNDIPTFRVDHMPYGGIKNSGFGREGIKYAMKEMLEPKLLIKNTI